MSSISSLAASLASAIEQEVQELDERKELLEKEKELLTEEKRRMSNFAALGSDLVRVNVGGKVFQTNRATLLSAEGSLLEAVFSGRWEDSLVRDEVGNVFFDFDPVPFRALLNYLRTRSIAEPGQTVPPPQVPQEYKAQFETMVSFMGLQETVKDNMLTMPQAVPEQAMAMTQVKRDGSITIQGGNLRKTADSREHCCVVGKAPLLHDREQEQKKLAWKVSIVQHSSGALLAGVTTNPAPPDYSYTNSGTYGWNAGGQVWSGGNHQGAAGGWPGWQTGDIALFQLDASQQALRMHLRRTGQVYTLPLPADLVLSARLHFNLFCAGDSVEVAQATSQELSDAGF